MITTTLLNKCINSISGEIKDFEVEITYLKERLLITQRVIRSLYSLPYSKKLDNEIRTVLSDNKYMLKKLSTETEIHSTFENILFHLHDDTQNSPSIIEKDLSYIIKYYEKKEFYEICASFKQLLDDISEK